MLVPAREKLWFPVVLSLAVVPSISAACAKKKKVQLSLCPFGLSKGQMQPQTVTAVPGVVADSSCFLFEDEGKLKNLKISRLTVVRIF